MLGSVVGSLGVIAPVTVISGRRVSLTARSRARVAWVVSVWEQGPDRGEPRSETKSGAMERLRSAARAVPLAFVALMLPALMLTALKMTRKGGASSMRLVSLILGRLAALAGSLGVIAPVTVIRLRNPDIGRARAEWG
jgi:hypothetical protein